MKDEKKTEAKKADKPTPSDIARETMTGDLRDCILDFMKHDKNPLPWNLQGENAQRETIEKVEKAVKSAVEKAVHIIAADARAVIVAKLDQVTVKDGIKATVSLSKADPLRHDLVDSQGLDVLMVVSSVETYKGEKKPVKITPDQKVLPGTDDDGEDDEPIFDKTPSGK